jgi:hypothetical protein
MYISGVLERALLADSASQQAETPLSGYLGGGGISVILTVLSLPQYEGGICPILGVFGQNGQKQPKYPKFGKCKKTPFFTPVDWVGHLTFLTFLGPQKRKLA